MKNQNRVDSLAEEFWRLVCEYSPTIATVRGVHEYNDRLRRFDDPWLDDMATRFRSIEKSAKEEKPTDLAVQDRITLGLLAHESDVLATEIEGRYLASVIDPYLGPHTRLLSDSQQNTVQTADQADALLGRYSKVPEYLEQALDAQRANAAAGMTPADASLQRVLDQLNRYLDSDIASDPFLQLDAPEAASGWPSRAEDLVRDRIRPAFEEYRDGLKSYLGPLARPDDKAGLVWMVNGEEIYRSLIHKYTQLDLSAQEIHEIGQDWGTRILVDEWEETGERALGLNRMASIFERLHNDPAMRFETEDEMLEHARDTVDRAWNAVDEWFATRPDTPCAVVPVPDTLAPAMPPAYYMQPPTDGSRPGTYFLNTYKPGERDRFEYESTHFHEAVPGHHFDRSIASSIPGLPTFRRFSQVYAHTEGWGLYSERLADEMGLFSSEVDRLGLLSADAWRSGRLVVDTGMHALGWSRQQAIDWFSKWTPISQLTVEQEVDRYIGMSGQALSYKMGQISIMDLRNRVEDRLGHDFDIKAFHDVMLVDGAMTLPMLEQRVNEALL